MENMRACRHSAQLSAIDKLTPVGALFGLASSYARGLLSELTFSSKVHGIKIELNYKEFKCI